MSEPEADLRSHDGQQEVTMISSIIREIRAVLDTRGAGKLARIRAILDSAPPAPRVFFPGDTVPAGPRSIEDDVPSGFERVWMPDTSSRWEVLAEPDTSHGCRWTEQGARCGRPSVARLDRSRRGSSRSLWWHYCERHLFGRRIVDGVIEHRILQPAQEVSPGGE